ncbi:hypothetical protein C8R44DRAFT_741876 [Mycena epipterygia]|nr:hypothetical protein C8R44DRAFT_741876 [Mycena epipterygia]
MEEDKQMHPSLPQKWVGKGAEIQGENCSRYLDQCQSWRIIVNTRYTTDTVYSEHPATPVTVKSAIMGRISKISQNLKVEMITLQGVTMARSTGWKQNLNLSTWLRRVRYLRGQIRPNTALPLIHSCNGRQVEFFYELFGHSLRNNYIRDMETDMGFRGMGFDALTARQAYEDFILGVDDEIVRRQLESRLTNERAVVRGKEVEIEINLLTSSSRGRSRCPLESRVQQKGWQRRNDTLRFFSRHVPQPSLLCVRIPR